eukprot:2386786-Pyramimonas_sp.AAC.2
MLERTRHLGQRVVKSSESKLFDIPQELRLASSKRSVSFPRLTIFGLTNTYSLPCAIQTVLYKTAKH